MALKEQNPNKLLKYIEIFFLVYILLQPFLDLVAFFGSSLSLGVRVIAMIIGLVYLFLYTEKKSKWLLIGYLVILGAFVLLNTVNNYFVKSPFFLAQELTYGIKSIYVIEMVLVYIAVFSSLKRRINWEYIVQRNIYINLTVIAVVMFLAEITNSYKMSYGTPGKLGHSGWFYSANDLSAILALGFGVMIIFIINKRNNKFTLVSFPLVLMVVWSMFTVGTKVGLGAVLAVLCAGVVLTIYNLIRKKGSLLNFIMVTVVLILSVIYIPHSAVGNNMGIQYSFFDSGEVDDENKTEQEREEEREEREEERNPVIDSNTDLLSKQTLNGRDRFLANTREDYNEAPFSQKLLGMGPGGNYEENLKLIEMDFLDWIFSYGIIGSILLFLPFVYISFIIIKRIIQYRFKQINPTFLMIGLEILLGIGIASLAGHIFLNPASGIYMAILFSYLYILSEKPDLRNS